MTEPTLLEALRRASEGLLFPSETDVPFEVVSLAAEPTPASLRAASGAAPDAPHAQIGVEAWFRPLATDRPELDAAGRAEAARFRALRDLILARLATPVVHRVGQVDVAIWVVGRDEQGRWVALRTGAVET